MDPKLTSTPENLGFGFSDLPIPFTDVLLKKIFLIDLWGRGGAGPGVGERWGMEINILVVQF